MYIIRKTTFYNRPDHIEIGQLIQKIQAVEGCKKREKINYVLCMAYILSVFASFDSFCLIT